MYIFKANKTISELVKEEFVVLRFNDLWVILYHLPEKGRREIEERVQEMKVRDRGERGKCKKVMEQKK